MAVVKGGFTSSASDGYRRAAAAFASINGKGGLGMVMGELENKILGVYAVTRDMRETHKAGLGPLYDLASKILHAPPRAQTTRGRSSFSQRSPATTARHSWCARLTRVSLRKQQD